MQKFALIQIVEKQLGDKLDLMSNVIRFHKDLFGGFCECEISSSKLDCEEKLSDPKRFQDFLVNFLQDLAYKVVLSANSCNNVFISIVFSHKV